MVDMQGLPQSAFQSVLQRERERERERERPNNHANNNHGLICIYIHAYMVYIYI